GSLSSARLTMDRLSFLFSLDRRISRRQINSDRRAVSWLAAYRRCPAGLFREAVHLAQTQTGPSRSFGRKKWIKNACQYLGRNANAGIVQFEHHKCATQAISLSTPKKLDPANCQRQGSAVRHCVTGVHTKVQQRKFEFALVDTDAARTAV